MEFNILLIDNDPVYSEDCREFLEPYGFNVFLASSVNEAKEKLENTWLHLALVDVRLTNHDDTQDISGLELAREIAPILPTLIVTSFPTAETARKAMRRIIPGKRSVIDYIDKAKPLPDLLQSIQEMIEYDINLNLNLKIDWKSCDRFSIISTIEPDLSANLIANRSAELEDLFRRIYKQDSIRLQNKLWNISGRIAIPVIAFQNQFLPESSIFVCGSRTQIAMEYEKFSKFAPKNQTDVGISILERFDTVHYGAIKYSVNEVNLDIIKNLSFLFQTMPEKIFFAALDNLFEKTLRSWHQEKPILISDSQFEGVYSDYIESLNLEDLNSRLLTIENQISTIGIKINRNEKEIKIAYGGYNFEFQDPLNYISKLPSKFPMKVLINTPGNINGESIIADENCHVSLTNFIDAGLAPYGWNIANLESEIRFDWINNQTLANRIEFEKSLIDDNFDNPDIRDLDSNCRKLIHIINRIRKYYSNNNQNNIEEYHYLVFLHALQRISEINLDVPLTQSEIMRICQIWFSFLLIGNKIAEFEYSEQKPVIDELSVKDIQERMILVNGREISLPPQPFAIFKYLFEHQNKVCTRKELITQVLGNKYDDQYLHSLIGRIRKAIGDDAEHPSFLITIPQSGYKLIPKP
jgi:DNA-binding response OmpR family regulator